MTVRTPLPAPSTPAPSRWRRIAALGGRGLLWLPGMLLGGMLAAAVAVGLWAGTEGSLARTLSWAQQWQSQQAPELGTLAIGDVGGSLIGGGSVARIDWTRQGTRVLAEGVRVDLGAGFWLAALRGEWRVKALRIESLAIEQDTTEPAAAPIEAPQSLTLPWSIDIPIEIARLSLDGPQRLRLQDLQAHYAYGAADPTLGVAEAHTLDMGSLRLADGRYRAQLSLGAQAPMPVRWQLQGTLQADVPQGERLELRARASAEGHLAGEDAQLRLRAQIRAADGNEATPTLAATASVHPWRAQPLTEADVRLHRLNLAMLWPEAPVTALSGEVRAEPAGDSWRAAVRLSNEGPGPLDQGRLPLRLLRADLEQAGARWTLSQLSAELADGQVSANGQIELLADPQAPMTAPAQLNLRFQRINPARLWSRMASAALDGSLRLDQTATTGQERRIRVDAQVQASGRQPRDSAVGGWRLRTLRVQAEGKPTSQAPWSGTWQIAQARLDALDGVLLVQGQLDPERVRFDGEASLDTPGARARWSGEIAQSQGGGELRIDVDDAGRLLSWARSLQALPQLGEAIQRLMDEQADLSAEGRANARLQWQGGLGALGWPDARHLNTALRLQGELNVPTLLLKRQTAGGATQSLRVSDTRLRWQGSPQALSLELQASAEQSVGRASLRSTGQLALPAGGLTAQRGELRVDQLQARITPGTADQQSIEWRLDSTEVIRVAWATAAQTPTWQVSPGTLQLLPSARQADAPPLTPVQLSWTQLGWQAGAWRTRGRMSGLPLAWVDALTTNREGLAQPLARAGVGGDLVFDGSWDLSLPDDAREPPSITASLARRSGDLAVQTDGAFDENAAPALRVQAGVRTARIDISTEARRLQARLRWDSERFGELSADLSSELSPPDALQNRWHWRADAPISGQARASLPQVGVWSVLAPPGWRVRGSLAAQATIGGTRAEPEISGRLQAQELALRSIVNGIAFGNGELRATLAGQRIEIERFRLEGLGGAARGGSLDASGSAEWARVSRDGVTRLEPRIALQARAQQLRVSSRPDRRLTVSGELRALLEGAVLQVRGGLRADEALLVLPDELAPSLSDDVVVRGTQYPIERAGSTRVQTDVQLDLDLGERFELRGQGLDTRLSGRLQVRNAPGQAEPRVVGEVRTVGGRYRAYGQLLQIETGVLRFSGPADNPALEITAVRGSTVQRVGVQISGVAQAPRVRLFSDPELPDSEKLAWLVLGRPASGAGAEAAVLQQAALALLSGRGGGPLDGGLAAALGLDSVSFSGSTSNASGEGSAALSLGKRLSDQLYLSYEHGLAGTLNTVSIFYDVSRRFTIRARAGSENAIDLIFTVQHD